MKTKELTKKEVKTALENILHWESDKDLEWAIDKLVEGQSFVVDAIAYIGNGKWVKRETKKRYRYKMIVPILDDNNNLYSTDLYEGEVKNAICADYGMYRFTRQKVVNVVANVDTDYSLERFGFGYKDGSYGIYKLLTPSTN